MTASRIVGKALSANQLLLLLENRVDALARRVGIVPRCVGGRLGIRVALNHREYRRSRSDHQRQQSRGDEPGYVSPAH